MLKREEAELVDMYQATDHPSSPLVVSSSTLMRELPNPLEPTIFHEPWWLELASSGKCEFTEVKSGGQTIGRLPFLLRKRFGVSMIEMPMLTHFLGPGLVDGNGSANNQFLRRLAITRELIQKLPKVALVNMKLHAGIGDAIAFQEQGFRTSVQFTHEIDPLPVKTLWANLRNKTRNVIRRAEEQLKLIHGLEPQQFMALYSKNLSARGMRNFLDATVCERLVEAAVEKRRGRIIAAFDSSGKLLGANFYIWDNRTYYFLLTTRTPESKNGTTDLLVWEAMKDASQRKLIFDSDGLNSRGSILFFSGLGGTVKPRYIVSRRTLTGRLLELRREVVWGENYFVRG